MESTRTEAIIAKSVRTSVKSFFIIVAATVFIGLSASYFASANYVLSAICLLGFLCFLVIQTILVDDWIPAILSSLVYSFTLSGATYFSSPDLSFSIISSAFLVSFIFFLSGQISGRNTLENNLKISFGSISRSVVGKAVTGIVIFLSIFYGFSRSPGEGLSFYLSKITGRASSVVLKYYLPNVSADMKVGDFFREVSENEAREIVPDFGTLPEKIRIDAITKIAGESIDRIESSFKISLDTEDSVKNQIEKTVSDKVTPVLKAFDDFYVSSAIAVLVFIVLIAASPVVSLAAVIVGVVIYEALIVFRFAKRTYEPRDKEIVSL